jgi:transketolase
VIYIYSHDSIGLGEDGPTHQPIEQTAAIRGTPNLSVWRPCDTVETAIAWRAAVERQEGPTALLLSRQTLQAQPHTEDTLKNIARGGYILKDSEGTPDTILIATGSEVQLAMEAADVLTQKHNRKIRVVSMPSIDVFLNQEKTYQETVLPPNVTHRIAIEAGVREPWYQFACKRENIIGIDQFGLSAPMENLFEEFGFTVKNIVSVSDTKTSV